MIFSFIVVAYCATLSCLYFEVNKIKKEKEVDE